MASLIIQARLLSAVDQPVNNQLVIVESFDLAAREWRPIAEAQSDRNGLLKATLDLRQLNIEKLGPALRLATNGRRRRVISAGPMFQISGRQANILADFGEIEILGDADYPRISAVGREGDTVGGLPRRKEQSLARLILNAGEGGDAVARRDTTQPGTTGVTRGSISRADIDPILTAEIETLHAINVDNGARLAEKDRLISAREHELSLKTTQLEDALRRATLAENRLSDLQSAARGEPAQIDAVVANIGTKIGAASATLKTSSNPFRIGNIRVDLKGALAEDGRIFLGGDRGDGSGFSVEMSPEVDGARGEVQVTVPDVTGLTQSAARRVLRSVGLRLSAAIQPMAAGTATHGHSLRQTPAAGRTAAHGSDVIVVFARIDNTQEQA